MYDLNAVFNQILIFPNAKLDRDDFKQRNKKLEHILHCLTKVIYMRLV